MWDFMQPKKMRSTLWIWDMGSQLLPMVAMVSCVCCSIRCKVCSVEMSVLSDLCENVCHNIKYLYRLWLNVLREIYEQWPVYKLHQQRVANWLPPDVRHQIAWVWFNVRMAADSLLLSTWWKARRKKNGLRKEETCCILINCWWQLKKMLDWSCPIISSKTASLMTWLNPSTPCSEADHVSKHSWECHSDVIFVWDLHILKMCPVGYL